MTQAQLSDISAESAVLSAALYREDWRMEVLQRLSFDDFVSPDARAVYTVIANMESRGEKVSAESLTVHNKELKEAGFVGRESISNLALNIPSPHDFPAYLETVKEMTARRAVYRAASTAQHLLDSGSMSSDAYDELERVVMERTATGMHREILSPSEMGDAIEAAVLERLDEKARKKRVIYSTFGSLNRCSGGFEKGDLIILSAESGAGKSAFSMNIAYGIACSMKRPLLYLNSEMSTNQNALRWASFLSKVSHSALRNGSASAEDAGAAIGTAEMMRKSALWTVNMPDMQIASVIAELRRAKAQHHIEMAIVDYIGRMDSLNMRDAKEWQVMKSAAQRLKTIAIELEIAVIMVAQLTSDGGRLAQSSYMAHEADLWINLSRVKEETLQSAYPWNYFLTFRKARNVAVGKEIPLRFDGDTLRFTDRKEEASTMAGVAPPFAGMKTKRAREEDIPA